MVGHPAWAPRRLWIVAPSSRSSAVRASTKARSELTRFQVHRGSAMSSSSRRPGAPNGWCVATWSPNLPSAAWIWDLQLLPSTTSVARQRMTCRSLHTYGGASPASSHRLVRKSWPK